jgi:hypothetical protein
MKSNAALRPLLSQTCSEYGMNLTSQFMGLDILPPSVEASKTGTFTRLVIENVTNGTGTGLRAPAAGYERSDSTFEETTYTTKEYGLEEPTDDSEAARYSQVMDYEREVSELLTYRLMRLHEKRVAAKVFNTTTFSGFTGAVSDEWSGTTSTPYNDINDAILTLKRQLGGVTGNSELCLAMSELVFRQIVKTTQIQGKILGGDGSTVDKVSNETMIAPARLASILGIDRVVISAAQDGGSDIWDDEYALLYYRSAGRSLRDAQIGRTFMWDEANNPYTVESYRDEAIRGDIMRVRHHTDENVFVARAGYLFSNVSS